MSAQENEQRIIENMELAKKNGIHVDIALNPFLSEEERQDILAKNIQDPEWD